MQPLRTLTQTIFSKYNHSEDVQTYLLNIIKQNMCVQKTQKILEKQTKSNRISLPNIFTKYIYHIYSLNIFTQNKHSIYSLNIFNQEIHSIYSVNIFTQYFHSRNSIYIFTQYIHLIYSFKIFTQYIH